MTSDRRAEPAGLLAAFWEYERALMANDLAALDRLFAPGAQTLRGDAHGLLVGHEAISAFRGGRGGAPGRRVVETHVQAIDEDHALVVAVTELARGGRGQQTQFWTRLASGWAVSAAYVAVPAPPLDTRIWRVVGDPLVPGSGSGRLAGESIAVKDLYAVAGQRVGAGNPAWLAQAPVETAHAHAVGALVAAGAAVRGIARTDEFAWSLAGTNPHSGTPPNPRAPYRIPGGSSSGSASAVSLGHASIGLGTDTGGSIRVPAAYQGLYGLRTTHDLIPREGLRPLAPSFDTVGWLTRDAELLRGVGEVLLPGSRPGSPGGSQELVVVPELLDLATPDVARAVLSAVPQARRETWHLPLADWLEAFSVLQAWEAWQQYGAWVQGRLDAVGPGVAARFANASTLSHQDAERAAAAVARARARIRDLVGDRMLVLPSTSSVAPGLGDPPDAVRAATLRLTSVAGLGGLPALSVPVETAEGLPCGVCFVAAPGRDRDLLELAVRRSQEPARSRGVATTPADM